LDEQTLWLLCPSKLSAATASYPHMPHACMQDKLRDYEKQIQELTSRLNTVEREKSNYEIKCGEMEKVCNCSPDRHCDLTPLLSRT
jgi:hypothetical protein